MGASYSTHFKPRGIGTFCTESVWDGSSQTLWIHPLFAFSFDHLVGKRQQLVGHSQSECLSGLEVDHQVVLDRVLHGQVGRLLTLENAVDITSRESVVGDDLIAV